MCTMKACTFLTFVLALLCETPAPAQDDKWMEQNSAGIRLINQGDFAAAEVKFRSALLESEKFGEGDFRYTANLSNIAFARQQLGDLGEAGRLYRRVLELREKYAGPDSPAVASTLNNLSTVLHTASRDAEADALARRALLIAEKTNDEKLIASILNTLALALMGEGEDARAEPVLRRAMVIFERTLGSDALDVGKTANNLSAIYSNRGDFVKAEELERIALPLYQKNLPPDHPLIAVVMNNMFTILGAQKRYDEAEPYVLGALEISEKRDPRSLQSVMIRGNLGALQAARGKYKEAAATLRSVTVEKERLLGSNHPSLAETLASYSDVLRHLNQKPEAKQAERRANEIFKKSFRH